MSLWKRVFGQQAAEAARPETAASPAAGATNRRIRVFISSTFRDMVVERDVLMTHTWPALRRLCQERHVELVEVDLRWGIAESQSTRRDTLKLCLDEIRACRPFFIGLLGERYGWVPDEDAFSADLQEEQPWLAGLRGKSVTELEILHGVLNNPDMAGRAFFYFRDPAYARDRGTDFLSESEADAEKLSALKSLIRATCAAKGMPLREGYADANHLAALVLADLSAAIEAQFPKESVPDPLTREAEDHEAFAETRRRTYIGRAEYVDALDCHAAGEGGPLALLGEAGSGKSALLANWLAHWRAAHPRDVIVQHYIGGTADSADAWRLMIRVMAEIKRWCGDPEVLPASRDDVLRDFPRWLSKARARAGQEGVRFMLVLDALNQLEDRDHARLLGWLPEDPFRGPLRLIVSTLPGASGGDDPLVAIQKRRWQDLRVEPLTVDERRRMIAEYLARFGKTLDEHRLARLASATPAANPLYLKILLDELRVTGTHDRLDDRLTEYLSAADIPALLRQVLARCQRDYEHDRPSLVADALGLIYAARRGLSETELLELLRPADQERLPPAIWAPLRAAIEDALVDRSGILNFAHDFLRTAAGDAFAADLDRRDDLRLQLADYFEAQPVTDRACDELPWLLKEADALARLRACLLHIDRFLLICQRDAEELRGYWVQQLREQQSMGRDYLESFERWSREPGRRELDVSFAAIELGAFLHAAALYAEAEPLLRWVLQADENRVEVDHPHLTACLNNLAQVLHETNRLAEAEPLLRRALDIDERRLGADHPRVAIRLNNLARLLQDTNRPAEAEPLMRRALGIEERSFGTDHPRVAIRLNNVAGLLLDANRFTEAEPLIRRALGIDERSLGTDHPDVARDLGNLAGLLQATNRHAEAEPLLRRALDIDEHSFGTDHPHVAIRLDNLAGLLQATNRLAEAEPLLRRALDIDERSLGRDHPHVARDLNNLAEFLHDTNRLAEAEPLMRRALAINEHSLGTQHPDVAICLNNLARLLQDTSRFSEAEPLLRRALAINEHSLGADHPLVATLLNNLAQLLQAANRPTEAEPLLRRALDIDERSFGADHPDVAVRLNNLALLLQDTGRLADAEPLMRRALDIEEQSFGTDHPDVGLCLNNLAGVLQATNRLTEAEPLLRRALAIAEHSFGADHPSVSTPLNNLAQLLLATNRLAEAEPLMRRALEITIAFTHATGHLHPRLQDSVNNYGGILQAMGHSREEIMAALRRMAPDIFN